MMIKTVVFLLLSFGPFFIAHSQFIPEGRRSGDKSIKPPDKKNNEKNFKAKKKKDDKGKGKEKDKEKEMNEDKEKESVKQGMKRTRNFSSDDISESSQIKRKRVNPVLTEKDFQEILDSKSMEDLGSIFERLKNEKKISGHERMGYAAAQITPTERIDYTDRRDIQGMRHIITNLFYIAGCEDADKKLPVEFQMMRITNRDGEYKFFISSNDQRSLDNIAPILLEKNVVEVMESYILSDLTGIKKNKKIDEMLERTREKMEYLWYNNISVSNDRFGEFDLLRAFALSIGNDNRGRIEITDDDEKNFLTDEMGQDIINSPGAALYLVEGKDFLHAEMKFIDLLTKMEQENPDALDGCSIDIIGTRRPCAGCAGKLQLFADMHEKDGEDDDDHSCKIEYTHEHGRIWKGSLLQLLQSTDNRDELLPVLKELFKKTYKSQRLFWAAHEESMSEADDIDEDDIDEDDYEF